MRKVSLVAALVTACVMLLPGSAQAFFDPHFSVLAKTKSTGGDGDTFRFQEKLLDPSNPVDKVGWDRGVCEVLDETRAFCRVFIHFSGEIGGHGNLRVSGIFKFPDDNRLNVNGGSDAYDGAAGKVLVTDLGEGFSELHFDLVR